MTIDINKQYRTRNNLPVTILKTDLRGCVAYPVVAVVHYDTRDYVMYYAINGAYCIDETSCHDLIEYHPAQDLALDQPIWVRDSFDTEWQARHFKEYKNDRICCWPGGFTSHTVESLDEEVHWKFFTTDNPNK